MTGTQDGWVPYQRQCGIHLGTNPAEVKEAGLYGFRVARRHDLLLTRRASLTVLSKLAGGGENQRTVKKDAGV